MPALRSLSLREAFLLPMLWRLLVRLNLILPVAVKRNRLAAAFLLFIFIGAAPYSGSAEAVKEID